jgi:hypothetical protein
MSRIAGYLSVQVNGEVYNAVGNFTFNIGSPKREMLVGPDRIHGYKEMPQVPFIEGEIRDSSELDLATLTTLKDATATLALANGKTIVLKDAVYVSDGNVQTEEANIQFRLEGTKAEEVPA